MFCQYLSNKLYKKKSSSENLRTKILNIWSRLTSRNQRKDISFSQIRLRSPKCRVHALLITSQSTLFVYSLSNNARYFEKKNAKLYLQVNCVICVIIKLQNGRSKNLGKMIFAIGIKYTVLFL